MKGERDSREVRFVRVDCYENLYLTRLIEEMTKGTIAIDFDVREMRPGSDALRNHGTKFRVAPDNVSSLYLKHQRIT